MVETSSVVHHTTILVNISSLHAVSRDELRTELAIQSKGRAYSAITSALPVDYWNFMGISGSIGKPKLKPF